MYYGNYGNYNSSFSGARYLLNSNSPKVTTGENKPQISFNRNAAEVDAYKKVDTERPAVYASHLPLSTKIQEMLGHYMTQTQEARVSDDMLRYFV